MDKCEKNKSLEARSQVCPKDTRKNGGLRLHELVSDLGPQQLVRGFQGQWLFLKVTLKLPFHLL